MSYGLKQSRSRMMMMRIDLLSLGWEAGSLCWQLGVHSGYSQRSWRGQGEGKGSNSATASSARSASGLEGASLVDEKHGESAQCTLMLSVYAYSA